jgi:hypothetical protein
MYYEVLKTWLNRGSMVSRDARLVASALLFRDDIITNKKELTVPTNFELSSEPVRRYLPKTN